MSDLDLPRRMIAAGHDPLGEKVNVYNKMFKLRAIIDALRDDERDFIAKSSLGKLLEIPSMPSWSASFGLFLLSQQLDVSKEKEIWVIFAGTPVRFSLREFKIVTGLPCGKYPPKQKKKKKGTAGIKIPYYSTLFGLEEDVTVDRVIAILSKKSKGEFEVRIRYACLALVDGFLLPTSHYPKVVKEHVEMIEDIDQFLAYPWGRASFDMIMSSVRERDVAQLATTSVAVQGFFYALQLVVLQAAPAIQEGADSANVVCTESDDDFVSGNRIRNSVPFKMGNAREVDERCVARVTPIICPEYEVDSEEDLSWTDEEEDEAVDNLVQLAEEGFEFCNEMFTGGCIPAELTVPKKSKRHPTSNPVRRRGVCKQRGGNRNAPSSRGERNSHFPGQSSDTEFVSMEKINDLLDKKLEHFSSKVVNSIISWFGGNIVVEDEATAGGSKSQGVGKKRRREEVSNTRPFGVNENENLNDFVANVAAFYKSSSDEVNDVRLPPSCPPQKDPVEKEGENNGSKSVNSDKNGKNKGHEGNLDSSLDDADRANNVLPDFLMEGDIGRDNNVDTISADPTMPSSDGMNLQTEVRASKKADPSMTSFAVLVKQPENVTRCMPTINPMGGENMDSFVGLDFEDDVSAEGNVESMVGNVGDCGKEPLCGHEQPEEFNVVLSPRHKPGDKSSLGNQVSSTDHIDHTTEGDSVADTVDEDNDHSTKGAHVSDTEDESMHVEAGKTDLIGGYKSIEQYPSEAVEGESIQLDVEAESNRGTRRSKRLRTISSRLDGRYKCDKKTKTLVGHPSPINSAATDMGELEERFKKSMEKLKEYNDQNPAKSVSLSNREIFEIIEQKKELSSKVMDVLLIFSRHLFRSDDVDGEKLKVEVFDTKFVSQLTKLYPKFSKAVTPEEFIFPDSLISTVIGNGTKDRIQLFTEAESLYLPFNFDKKHWVALCIDLKLSQITVLDCNTRGRAEVSVLKDLQPIAIMLPYLFRQALPDRVNQETPVSPLSLYIEKDIPQISGKPLSGVLSVFLIHTHATGGIDECQHLDIRSMDTETKKLISAMIQNGFV